MRTSPSLRDALDVAPQTNEVGRSVALLAGLSEAVRRTGLAKVRLLEPGASAGLNLLVDRFRFVGDGWSAGPSDAHLVLDGCEAPGFSPATFEVVERRGCDLDPFEATTDEGAAYLRSFVWPHMPERDGRLVAALATLRETPVAVDRAGAAEWVRARLAESADDDVLTVVWHSITRQYWPPQEYAAMLAAIDEARPRMPVARVALEDPDPLPTQGSWRPQVEVDDDVIGWCTHHGPPLEARPEASTATSCPAGTVRWRSPSQQGKKSSQRAPSGARRRTWSALSSSGIVWLDISASTRRW